MNLLKKFLEEELSISGERVIKEFNDYNKYLTEWNSKVNVISRKNESIENIVLNSIFFLTKYKFNSRAKVVDIGTGGGFPGIPLKILFPDTEITLCDSIRKKINVVDDIIKQMGLINAEAICSRVFYFYQSHHVHDKYCLRLDYLQLERKQHIRYSQWQTK